MVSKKDLIGNALMKEIISIRIDTLWKMIGLRKEGRLPSEDEEGATGEQDNKGALFIPGGLVFEDVDERPIKYDSYGMISEKRFRRKIRNAMKYDNATLLFPDGIQFGVNLDNGFFSKAARQIFTLKKAAMKRKKKFTKKLPLEISSEDITRSNCPSWVKEPYGARTRLSSCVSAGLVDPAMYYAHCKTVLRLNEKRKEKLANNLNVAQEPIFGKDGEVLSPPYIIVCHNTRYRQGILTGITRVLGIGKFGKFATFTLEEATKNLLQEIKKGKEEFTSNEIIAEYDEMKVIGILRIYSSTTPGKRAKRSIAKVISPQKDLGIAINEIEEAARERYKIH
jgi:hypothetical protein